jgi:hypothetical protein|tara:strand:+ start:172 stop:705 length:534 start_codon:yes stop_codon:yes gene_type:complete
MIRDQLFLFPELDPFKTIVKNIDYVDLSTLQDIGNSRKNSLENLPRGKYLLFQTGGFNKFVPDLGKVFPYIQNQETKNIPSIGIRNSYCNSVLHEEGIGYSIDYHRVTALAFIVNNNSTKQIWVDHKNGNRFDFRVSNLRWVTPSQNRLGTIKEAGKHFIGASSIGKLGKYNGKYNG